MKIEQLKYRYTFFVALNLISGTERVFSEIKRL